jgi:hypothetical protein
VHRALLPLALLACGKAKSTPRPVAHDAAVVIPAPIDAAPDPLADYPRVDAVRTLAIPTTKPRSDEVGPTIAGDLAIVGGSGFGFAAIDYQRGDIAWTKPAGARLAPPLVHESSIVLVSDCERMLPVPDGERLLGCLRVVTTTGADQSVLPIHGKGLDAFAADTGPQALYDDLRWVRGTHAVRIDLFTGAARPASAAPPPLDVTYRGTRFRISHEDGRIVARGKRAWQTEHRYTAITGVVWADRSPLLRIVNLGTYAGAPEAHVIEMDATGSLHAAVGRPTPGTALLGHATNDHTALALRGDVDFIAGYAANARLVYVHALPPTARTRVGVAVTGDAVVVFHDGDRITVLPALSAPPTAPGASKNPTP